ncbi:hypothetical protein D3C84_1060730 [compost metagenome]
MNDPARPEIGLELDSTNGRARCVVVQRCIGVGAGVRRQGYAPDIDRTVVVDLPAALLLERRVTRPGGGTAVQRRADVP